MTEKKSENGAPQPDRKHQAASRRKSSDDAKRNDAVRKEPDPAEGADDIPGPDSGSPEG
ncbi:hypothetical protein [Stakelama saccharophila]|uniref:Uncharacterized protein n=1 Tax=Stakelama saccharophila TaxID=3075605 RepID=A0ABZ0B646_9SPHN|nr:hypothetical protein [Stakelama sp. W311]WNO52712.1 hypothetical protein RPR59_09565 [Stakelama sp. W311]